MKIIVLFLLLFATTFINAQVVPKRDPKANAFYKDAMPVIRPVYKNLVVQTASQFKRRSLNSDSLATAFRRNPQLKTLGAQDIEGLTLLVMVETSKNLEAEISELSAGMKDANKQKQDQRLKPVAVDSVRRAVEKTRDQKDSLSEMNEMEMMMLQQLMQQRQQLEQMISNLMKQLNDTQGTIIGNMK